ncbi:MAG: hypothetical protein ISS78_03410 [Phycisphaerae bacterium]|nr:hypothetical protein [Phycisphaerae bacterium]
MINREKMLVWLLRFFGGVMLLAVVAVCMPGSWMAACHEWLGLGKFPDAPIADYLARSLSAFYAIMGGLVLLISGDIRRYATIITYVAVVCIVFGVATLVIDVRLALPTWWIVGEGPFVAGLGVVILIVQARAKRGAATRLRPDVHRG